MAMNLSNLTSRMTPKMKMYTVVGAAVVGVLAVLWITMGGSQKGPEQRWNPKTDKQVNVITNDNQKNMGLDAMAGRIKYLDSQNRRLQDQVQGLIKDRQTDKADTTKEREWRERFDALTSEVNKLRAQQRDVNVMMSQNKAGAKGPNNQQIDDPFQVREQKKREILGDELENSIKGSAGTKRSGSTGSARSSGGSSYSSGRRGSLQINVVSDPDAKDEALEETSYQKPQEEDNKSFLPAGSILTGTLITGADFPTGAKSRDNPTPVLIRLQKTAILPNLFRSDVRECFLLASGHGDLSTERANLRSEMISCVRSDGSMIQSKLSGYVAGEDGKAGMRGRLVSKTGTMIARTMVAGFLSGMAQAFDYDPVEVLSTTASNNVQYQSNWSADAAKSGLASGLTKSLDRVADFYMNLADQMTPVVEIGAGRQVDVVVISKTDLTAIRDTRNGELANRPGQTMHPTNAVIGR